MVRNGSGVGLRKALAKHVGAASQPGVRHLFVHSCRSVVVQGVAARSLAMTACPRALAVCGVHQLRTKSAPNGPRQVGSWSTPSSDTIGPKRPSLCRKLEYTKFGRVSVAPWMGFGRAADAVDGVRTSRGRRGCAGWAQRRRVRSGPMSRVLSRTIIYLLTPLPTPSSAQPERRTGRPIALLFAFAPEGACQAAVLPRRWWSLAPPFQLFSHLLAQAAGVFFSAALSVGSPRLAVSQLPALWSPDFPHDSRPIRNASPAIVWPTSRKRFYHGFAALGRNLRLHTAGTSRCSEYPPGHRRGRPPRHGLRQTCTGMHPTATNVRSAFGLPSI